MAKTASNADTHAGATASTRVTTTGEMLRDGRMIELVRDREHPGLKLLIRDGKRTRIAGEFECEGRIYVPAELNSSYRNCMRLPAKVGPLGETRELFDRISELIQQFGSLEPPMACLATCFAFSTWFVDIFPKAPLVLVTGPRFTAQELLRILSCFCRRALLIEAVSHTQLACLPLNFCPTLLIDGSMHSAATLRSLIVPASSDFAIPGPRGLVQCGSAKAICTGTPAPPPLGHGGIRMATSPRASAKSCSTRTQLQIAEEFQPQLLAYRLANYDKVLSSEFDVPDFACSARVLGRSLGASLVGDVELQARVIPLLEEHSAGEREEYSSDLNAYLIEALVVACHQQKRSVYVGEIAKTANLILFSRGETIVMSPREVGGRLRGLGLIPTRLGAAGYGILLTQKTCAHIHRLAADYNVKTLAKAGEQFPCCAPGN